MRSILHYNHLFIHCEQACVGGNSACESTTMDKVSFRPCREAFPTGSVFAEGDASLDSADGYRELAEQNFGETETVMAAKVEALKNRLREEGLELPDCDHLRRKLLRGGGLDVDCAVKVLRTFFQMRRSHPLLFRAELSSDRAFDARFLSMMPYRLT